MNIEGVLTATSLDCFFPYLSPVREGSRLVLLKADSLAAQGRWKEAIDLNRQVMLLGTALSRGGVLINHLVDVAVYAMAAEQWRKWLIYCGDKIPLEYLEGTQVWFNHFPEMIEPLPEAFRAERMFLSGLSVSEILTSEFGSASSGVSALAVLVNSSEERMVYDFDLMYAHLIIFADGKASQKTMRFIDIMEHPKKNQMERFLTHQDPIGNVLAQMLLPAVTTVKSKIEGRISSIRSIELMIALIRYKRLNDNYPATIDELMPDVLTTIPRSPYGLKEPLRYKLSPRKGVAWVIYDIGPDGIDNGGVVRKSKQRYLLGRYKNPGDDIVFPSHCHPVT